MMPMCVDVDFIVGEHRWFCIRYKGLFMLFYFGIAVVPGFNACNYITIIGSLVSVLWRATR